MTTLENIRDALPGYARDLQLNLGTVLTPAGAPGLSERQIWAVALAAAAASRNPAFSLRFQALAARHLDAAHVSAAHVRGVERSEEHTSELQSQSNLVCRLLLEKKNKKHATNHDPESSD